MSARLAHANSHQWMVASALAALLVACDVKAPEYVRPDVPLKQTWQGAAAQPPSARETIQPDWWRGFDSAYLDELVNKAIADGSIFDEYIERRWSDIWLLYGNNIRFVSATTPTIEATTSLPPLSNRSR